MLLYIYDLDIEIKRFARKGMVEVYDYDVFLTSTILTGIWRPSLDRA